MTLINEFNIIEQLINQSQNNEMIDSHYTKSGDLMMKAAELIRKMHNQHHIIGNDYIELSHEKIEWQRNDYIKRCRKLVEEFHNYDK